MFFGYGIVNNHAPILKATVMKIGAAVSSLLTGLYAVYKGESNANDSLGAYNGTSQGGLTYTTGKSGNAFTFNGTNAYVDLGNNIFNSFTSDFSVSMWINVNSVSGNQALFSNLSYHSSNVSNGFFVVLRGNSILFELYKNNNTYEALSTGGYVSTGTWYNVVVTRKVGTRSRIYVNGTLLNSNASTLNPTYDTSLLPIPSSIGAWRYDASNVTNYTNGNIDELNAWNKELTSTEITDLYNAGTGKFYPTF